MSDGGLFEEDEIDDRQTASPVDIVTVRGESSTVQSGSVNVAVHLPVSGDTPVTPPIVTVNHPAATPTTKTNIINIEGKDHDVMVGDTNVLHIVENHGESEHVTQTTGTVAVCTAEIVSAGMNVTTEAEETIDPGTDNIEMAGLQTEDAKVTQMEELKDEAQVDYIPDETIQHEDLESEFSSETDHSARETTPTDGDMPQASIRIQDLKEFEDSRMKETTEMVTTTADRAGQNLHFMVNTSSGLVQIGQCCVVVKLNLNNEQLSQLRREGRLKASVTTPSTYVTVEWFDWPSDEKYRSTIKMEVNSSLTSNLQELETAILNELLSDSDRYMKLQKTIENLFFQYKAKLVSVSDGCVELVCYHETEDLAHAFTTDSVKDDLTRFFEELLITDTVQQLLGGSDLSLHINVTLGTPVLQAELSLQKCQPSISGRPEATEWQDDSSVQARPQTPVLEGFAKSVTSPPESQYYDRQTGNLPTSSRLQMKENQESSETEDTRDVSNTEPETSVSLADLQAAITEIAKMQLQQQFQLDAIVRSQDRTTNFEYITNHRLNALSLKFDSISANVDRRLQEHSTITHKDVSKVLRKTITEEMHSFREQIETLVVEVRSVIIGGEYPAVMASAAKFEEEKVEDEEQDEEVGEHGEGDQDAVEEQQDSLQASGGGVQDKISRVVELKFYEIDEIDDYKLPLGSQVCAVSKNASVDFQFPGTVVNHMIGQKHEIIVKWNGKPEAFGYSLSDVSPVDQEKKIFHFPINVPEGETMEIGVQVKRGPDWDYEEQDEPHGVGTVIRVDREAELVQVKWKEGRFDVYSYSLDKKEIEIIEQSVVVSGDPD